MATIWAEQALTADGWASDVTVEIGADSRITAITTGSVPSGQRVGILFGLLGTASQHRAGQAE